MKILLLKEKKDPDNYFDALSEIGEVVYIPVLSITFANQDQFENLLLKQSYTSIIFTSGNAVKAIERIIERGVVHPDLLQAMKCYVVGKATEKLAKRLGFECFGQNAGNAEELARIIIKDNSDGDGSAKYLFPCSQMKRDVLPDMMETAGCNLTCITTYNTTEQPHLQDEITAFAGNTGFTNAIVVFFSPSGVVFSLPKFLEVFGDKLEGLHCAAIGKTTAEALVESGVEPCCVAQRPSPESLSLAIQSFMRS